VVRQADQESTKETAGD